VTHSGVFYYLLDFTIHYSKFTIPPPGGWRGFLCLLDFTIHYSKFTIPPPGGWRLCVS